MKSNVNRCAGNCHICKAECIKIEHFLFVYERVYVGIFIYMVVSQFVVSVVL
jgi:hypothetical protein